MALTTVVYIKKTRTAVIKFQRDDKFYAAFDDIDDPKENILLARAQQGYDMHKYNNAWFVSTNDALIKGALQRAEQANRIVEIPSKGNRELSLTQKNNCTTEYGNNQIIRATIGDMAEQNATWLRQKGYQNGYEWLFVNPQTLKQLGVNNNTTEIRAISVLGISFVNLAVNQCYSDGLARRVRKKFP